jgi:hypothetical protein
MERVPVGMTRASVTRRSEGEVRVRRASTTNVTSAGGKSEIQEVVLHAPTSSHPKKQYTRHTLIYNILHTYPLQHERGLVRNPDIGSIRYSHRNALYRVQLMCDAAPRSKQ